MSTTKAYFLVTLFAAVSAFQAIALLHCQDRIDTLQECNKALQDVQTGVDIHLQFVDSDHRRLEEEIIGLRRDLDEQRFLHGEQEK